MARLPNLLSLPLWCVVRLAPAETAPACLRRGRATSTVDSPDSVRSLRTAVSLKSSPVSTAVAMLFLAALAFAGTGDAADAADRFPPCADPGASGSAPCLTALDNIADCHFRGGFARWGEAPFTWSGSCRNGLAEGEGVLEDRAGNRQTGRFSAGLRRGMWRKERVDGGLHEGPYDRGQVHGVWTETHASGARSTGRYERGSPAGEWRTELPDGEVRRGPYREGLRHGGWVFERPDGARTEGHYAHGKKAGHWTYLYAGGRVDEGRMGNGVPVGMWTRRWPDGYSETGVYREGRRHGPWRIAWPDGRVVEAMYRDGALDGVTATRHPERPAEGRLYREGRYAGIAALPPLPRPHPDRGALR